jgi:PHD/YefM family antitoxin component YafN of YafNO toxin-antitoxin module
LSSLQETAYLLRSPANAVRLLNALNDSVGLTLPRNATAELDRVNAAVSARSKRARKPAAKK